MKKIALTLAIILGMGIGAFAQEKGLFGMGPGRESSGDNRTEQGLILPTAHGNTGDANATDTPLGSGLLLLAGLGAAYAASKRRKE